MRKYPFKFSWWLSWSILNPRNYTGDLCTHGAVPTAAIATGFYEKQSSMGGWPRLSQLPTAHLKPKRGPDRKENSAVGPYLSHFKTARGDPSEESLSYAGTLRGGNKGVWPYSLCWGCEIWVGQVSSVALAGLELTEIPLPLPSEW